MIKKLLFFLLVLNFTYQFAFAQLESGVIAPNWTLTDINDSTHTLYDYLDQGKSVVIDVSATWCGPCWSYHSTHALKDVYNNYGPNGTDEMMVFFIEGDSQTNLDCLYGTAGCNYSTQGDWVTGTPYPIINSTFINNSYQINYFPTVYLICPDRVITEIGQLTASEIYTEAQLCPQLTTTVNDAKIFKIIEPEGDYCAGDVTPKVKIQNYGTSTLSSVDIYSVVDGTTIDTLNWNGSLNMYETIQITLNQTPLLTDGNHTFEFITANPNNQPDEDITNDNMSSSFSTNSIGTEVTVKIKTDANPSQTSWDITLNGNIVASGGSFETANIIYQEYECLYEDSCYTFNVYDSGNNGLDGNSFGLIFWNGNTVTSFPASSFNDDHIALDFCLTSTSNKNIQKPKFKIYPNPTKSELFIEGDIGLFKQNNILITDIYGRIVKNINTENNNSNTIRIDVSDLSNGLYNIQYRDNKNYSTFKFVVID